MHRFCWLLLVLVALTTSPAAAEVSDRGTVLVWVRGDGAEECIAQDQLMTEVRGRLGRDPFHLPAEQRIEATVSKERGLWVARLFEHDPSGRRIGARVLSSATGDCRELEAAAALAIALIIDPEARSGVSPPTASLPQGASSPAPPGNEMPGNEKPAHPAPAVTPASDAGSASRDARRSEAPPRRASLPRRASATRSSSPESPSGATGQHSATSVLAGVALVSRLQPNLGPVFTVAAERVVAGHASVRLGVLFAPESRETNSDADYAVGLTTFRASGCYLSGQQIAAFGCAGALVGDIHSVVYRPVPNNPGDRWWVAAQAEAGVELGVGALLVDIEGLLLVPLTRWSFEVGGNSVFTQGRVLPGAAVSAGTRFW